MSKIGYEALADAIVMQAIKDAKQPTLRSYEDICMSCQYIYDNDCFCKNEGGKKYFRVKNKEDYFFSCDLKNNLLANELMSFFESEWFSILLCGIDANEFLEYHGIFVKTYPLLYKSLTM